MQILAVNSWKALGWEVYSFNSKEEIEGFKDFDIEFIEVELEDKRVRIDTFLDFARQHEDPECVLINSDILIYDNWGLMPQILERLPHSATIVKRRDFTNDINDNKVFQWGIDVFLLHKNYLHLFKPSNFKMGLCWWDYYIPYSLLTNGVQVYFLREPFAYHRMHNTQYSHQSWLDLGMEFKAHFGLKARNPMVLNAISYEYIMNNAK